MSRWIGVAIAAAWLTAPEAAMASPPVGPRDAVESAIVRILTLMRAGEVDGTPVPDRWAEIRKIARETFDFNEIGYSSSVTIVMLLLVVAVSLGVVWMGRRREAIE